MDKEKVFCKNCKYIKDVGAASQSYFVCGHNFSIRKSTTPIEILKHERMDNCMEKNKGNKCTSYQEKLLFRILKWLKIA